MDDFYELLGVSEDASAEEIDRAWRERVRRYHPDVNDDARATAQFKTLKAAHEVLSAEEKRAAYDRMGHAKYVRKRLDGLPTAGQPGPDAADDETDGEESTRSGDRSSTDRRSATGTGRSRSGRSSSSRSGSTRRSDSTGSATSDRTRSSSRTSANGQSTSRTRQTESQSRSSRRTRNTQRTERNRRAQSTTDSGDSAADAGASRETAATARRGLSRLQYAWISVVLAGAIYLAGLWQYLAANAGALGTLRPAVVSDPVSALAATGALTPPGTFALRAVSGMATTTLLFPIGSVVLAIAFVAVVVAVGRGSAYLYAVAGLAPLAGLAVGPVALLPTGAVLALVVVLPVGGTVLFALDVGRYVT